jgi:hypothetical protein
MTDEEREARPVGSETPLTRAFRQLAAGADAPDPTYRPDRIVDLAHQFEAASSPPEESEPPPP